MKKVVFYPGKLTIGVEYRRNPKMDKNMAYLFADGIDSTGKVETYTLIDEKNLSHRSDKSKIINVFLPHSYDGVTPHDILYFFDAQNLFAGAGNYTDNGDPYGSWQMDLVIAQLHRQFGKNIIVVGIDNADIYRSQELFMNPEGFGTLSPLAYAIPEDDFTHGYLEGLSSFMVGTLHNFIKKTYCVKEDNIGIGGSSMGGIASFYCGLRESGFYNYVLSYSPAFGLYEMSAFDNYFSKLDFANNKDNLPKIHIYCGVGDMLEEQLLPAAKEMKSLLLKHGYSADKIHETYDEEKPHNEESWRQILPESFSFLLGLDGV
jgi:predicted alpha/beta superfamily hydrolase